MISPLRTAAAALGLAVLLPACTPAPAPETGAEPAAPQREGALVGREAVPAVHLLENHSSALIAWRRADVRQRVLVHLDGHADIDWLPDETVARIAAAAPGELPDLELHPYALDGTTHERFAIWNFIYPAVRLGVVRELVWVVPDGTLAAEGGPASLVREMILQKMQMISPQEANRLHVAGRTVQGTLYGIPLMICELADLPEFAEPVLLDVDLDYFTTASAVTQSVTAAPWVAPGEVVDVLRRKGIRTDLATLSHSTIGGFSPPASRWLGRAMTALLRDPSAAEPDVERLRRTAEQEEAAGRAGAAEAAWRQATAAAPDDSVAWYGLARLAERRGGSDPEARRRAVALDPVLEHDALFEADRLFINREWEAARARYRAYADAHPGGHFAPYAVRREAGCLAYLGRTAEAEEAFRRVVSLAPRHADTRIDLGVLLRERGALPQAIEQFAEARAILPDLAVASQALGTTLLLAGRLEEGVAELQRAVERKPCSGQAQGNLAIGLHRLGRYREAAPHLELALRLQPGHPQYRGLLADLRRRGVDVTYAASHP